MIVPMKKVSILVPASRKKESVDQLRKLGVLHPETREVTSEPVIELEERKNRLEEALSFLGQELGEGNETANVIAGPIDLDAALALADRVIELGEEIRVDRDRIEALSRDRDRLTEWGDFRPDELRELRERGIDIRLYESSIERYRTIEGKDWVYPIDVTKKSARFAAVKPPEDLQEGFIEVPVPERSLSETIETISELQAEIGRLRELMRELPRPVPMLGQALYRVDHVLEFETVLGSMGEEAKVAWLTGFIPADQADHLSEVARKRGWAAMIESPDPEEQVPTMIRNPKWIGIIRPIFSLMGTVPGYREYDISLFFLLFFSVFFAMIIGDAGYGMILLGGSIFAIVKVRSPGRKVPPGVILLLVMSSATVVWGLITGTWFGSQAIAETEPFSWFIVPSLYSFNPRSSDTIKWFCFILGTVHLSIAHLWNLYRGLRMKEGLRVIAQLGWLSMVLGFYYPVLFLVLDPVRYPVPAYAIWLILGGFATVMLFAQQQPHTSFFIGVARGGANLMPTFLNGISAFSDIISYIRLFAVGLASIEIAKAFNAMASDLGTGLVGIIGGMLILLFGHALNLIMGALSVIVHGVRLNMLEFSGHLGMEWTGTPYRPFREASETPTDT